VAVLHTAPLVCSFGRSAVRASIEGTERVRDVRRYGAAGAGVDRNLVYRAVVDTFQDVDFTLVWPVGAVGPEGRPSAAPDRHVDGIKDEETTVEDVTAVETDRLPIARDSWGGLDAHNDIAGAVDLDELVGQSTILILVVNGAVGGIGGGPEVPAVEEGIALLEGCWSRHGPARRDRHGRHSHLSPLVSRASRHWGPGY